MKPFDINKPFTYRNGEPAILLTKERPGEYPIVTMDRCGCLYIHRPGGSYWNNSKVSPRDLINPPVKKTLDIWVLIFKDGSIYASLVKPDEGNHTECLHIVQEYVEGEGI